jgi:peptidoglycan/xylan/chitin deacetylase (PgdA/CDA1 family)
VFAPRQHLTAKELREIAGLGHEIGSHTMTHPDLVLLPPKQRRAELLDSRKLLEDVTGAPVTTISFPFGSWNIDVWETARECGYRAATAYRPHAHQPDSILPVLGAYAFDTPEDIMRKLEPAGPPSNALARAALMPHFAKGSPLWRFRPEYRLGRRSRRPPARCAR